MIKFTCCNCGLPLEAVDDFGAGGVICTHCNAETQVPAVKLGPSAFTKLKRRASTTDEITSSTDPERVLDLMRKRSAYRITRIILYVLGILSLIDALFGLFTINILLLCAGIGSFIGIIFYEVFLDIADCQIRLVRASERK